MIETAFVELPTSNWAPWLRARVDAALDVAHTAIATIKDGTARDTVAVLELWDASDLALRNAASITSLLAAVHPDADVRTLAEDLAQEVTRLETDRGLDRELYDVLAATRPVDDDQTERLRERVLRDYRRAGVDRSADDRARLREIADRSVVLEQEFARAIREDTRSIRLRPEQLDGLPDDFRDAHPVSDDGTVAITTDYPDLMPFLTFARDRAARLELMRAFQNRAWPANDAVLGELLALRAEQAQLLGYADWPDFDAEVKMIGSGKAILEFVERIVAASDTRAREELETLLARQRRDEPSATELTRADSRYYEELVRREGFDVDAQQVRTYFHFDRVLAGLLDITGRLFGLTYRERTDVTVWHDDVRSYDVDCDGEPLGRIYLDLHPRADKFKHAAQFDLAPGVLARQRPEGALVCNLPLGLMEHTHVTTLFHEFGHLVHHLLAGRQRYVRFSGVATEWDFVEAPSQLLEEWAWDVNVLQSFARDEAGTPIPGELVERMEAARGFGIGSFVRGQNFYAALSYLLHRDRPADLAAASIETQRRYDLIAPIDGTHFYASFTHLAGYTSAYYTYLWSLVIAKDLFADFDQANLLDPAVARRYRDEILVPGGSRDAADLVEAFLGRPYSYDAFERWLDQSKRNVTRSSTGVKPIA